MYNVIKNNRFQDDGRDSYEKENLSYMLFVDMSLFHNDIGISFFRCDFRGSKFYNCHFFKNNLDRADFISCVFQKVTFRATQIASCEMKNCYFDDVEFSNGNYYNNTSIQECTFRNCRFESEQLLVNMKNCTFINCSIIDCSFERSTTERLTFIGSRIVNTDFATMHAERHVFKDCQLQRVYIGITYIFGYLFFKTNLDEMVVLYRGDEVYLENESTFAAYINDLWLQQRYYEFINANIIYKNFDYIPDILHQALTLSYNKVASMRKLDIEDILDSLCFYVENCILPYKCFEKVIDIVDSYCWERFPDDEYLSYVTRRTKIDMTVNLANFSSDFIRSAYDSISTVTFHCKTDDHDKALNLATNVLSEVCRELGFNGSFCLVDEEKGSWILTFAICSSIALLMPKLLKCYADVIIEIKTKKRISSQLEKKLSSKNLKLTDLKLLSEIAANAHLIPGGDINYEKIGVSELIDSIKVGL